MATGLLGPGPSTPSLNSPPAKADPSSGFVSNGLLGGLGTVSAHENPEALHEMEGVCEQSNQEHPEQGNSFEPNGLLGPQDAGECAHAGMGSLTSSLPAGRADSFVSVGILSGSQGRAFVSFACSILTLFYVHPDDHFPPISEILGLNPRDPCDTMSFSSRSFVPPLLCSSLRATTYDGKVIQIRRKQRTGTTRKARYEHRSPAFYMLMTFRYLLQPHDRTICSMCRYTGSRMSYRLLPFRRCHLRMSLATSFWSAYLCFSAVRPPPQSLRQPSLQI